MSTVVPPLWPHQHAALKAIETELAHDDGVRATVVMACGTGKTRLAAEVRRRLAAGGRAVVVVPTLELLHQAAQDYLTVLGADAGRLIGVCSDPGTMGRRTTASSEELGELENRGMLISTDPEKVAAELRPPGPVTVLVTFASLGLLSQVTTQPWDLVVIDEAHRSTGLVGREWSLVHYDRFLPAHRRLYMTATPRFYNSESDRHAYSMDDHTTYGPVVYELPFAQAIQDKLLADYRTVVGVVSDAEAARLEQLLRDAGMLSLDGHAVSAQMLAAQIALIRAIDEHGLRRVVTYHNTVAEARRFSETLLNAAALMDRSKAARPVAGYHVDGTLPLAERRFLLDKLDAPGQRAVVVSNCRVLAEGVDLPELDGVLFANPRDSAIDIIQAIGRALRRGSTDNKIATIIVPVMVRQIDPAVSELDSSRWSILWKIIRALRAHDERLGDILDAERARMVSSSGETGERLARWLAPAGIPVTAELVRSIQIKTIVTSTSPWWHSYGRVKAFYDLYGHLDIPAEYPDAQQIRGWMTDQRDLRRRGVLHPERARLLEAIGIEWDPSENERRRFLAAAARFRAEHGHLHVTDGHIEDGVELGRMLVRRRYLRKQGRIEPDEYTALDALGMPWDRARPQLWRLIEDLRAFHADCGHLDLLPPYATDSHRRIGTLLNKQLNKYDGNVEHIDDAAARAALQQLGLRSTKLVLRETLLAAVERFHADYGHLNIPEDHIDPRNGARLAAWLRDVDTGLVTLTGRDKKRWDACRSSTPTTPRRYVADRIADLQRFYDKHGHIDIATNDGDGLGRDLLDLRTKHRAGKLRTEDIETLDGMGIIWSPREKQFQDVLDSCDRYRAKYGDLAVPTDYVDEETGFTLGAKLVYYRQLAKGNVSGKLSAPARHALDQRGMIWDHRSR